MLNDFIYQKTSEVMGVNLTNSQKKLLKGLSDFIFSPSKKAVLIAKGYAGTGKTYLLSAFVKVLVEMEMDALLLAPTGRAAKVFSSYVNRAAFTIHKKVYRQQSATASFSTFNLNKNLSKDRIIIVDEASMISNGAGEGSIFGSGRLLDDLINFTFDGNNNRLILLGDNAQLPPVGSMESPALDKTFVEGFGCDVEEYWLTDVVRQTQESGILYNASEIRGMVDDYFEGFLPQFQLEGFKDIQRVSGEELIEAISSCYDRYGVEDTIVVTRSNKRSNLYNKGIRNSIFFKEEEITVGDLLLVTRNNYFWAKECKEIDFIANGDIAEIVRIKGYEELYDYRFANVIVRLIDYKDVELDVKIILDVLNSDAPGLTKEEQEKFYYTVLEDYQDLSTKKKRYDAMRENEYYNAMQVKFAYAMTCHKAQGGQWKAVFVDPGYVPDESMGVEYFRWLYTAITRSSEQLYLVNFKDEYFE